MARLVIEENHEKRYYRLTDDVTTIGRAEINSIQITDVKSSRCHCQITVDDEDYVLTDLESQNGTRVNEFRIVDSLMLKPGDVIQIGQTRITLDDESPSRRLPAVERPPASDNRTTPEATSRTRLRRRGLSSHGRVRRRKAVGKYETKQTEDYLSGLRTTLDETLDQLTKQYGDQGAIEAASVFEAYLEEGTTLSQAFSRNEKLERVMEINRAINSELDLHKLLELIMDAVIELTQADRGFLLLHEKNEMNIEVARNFERESLKDPDYQLSRSIAQKVASAGAAVISTDARDDERFTEFMSVMDLQLRSVMCIPLRSKDEVIGVVYLDNSLQAGLFDEDALEILEPFCDQAGLAIENARLHREIRLEQQKVEELNERLKEKVARQEVDLREARGIIHEQRTQLETKYNYENIVGVSEPMRRIFLLMDKITDSNAPVFIHGESGTGKELVARAIHFNGPRNKSRFVSENCAAISENLLESELFGYTRGAFTGAEKDKKGLFELAHSGTLFLDEIGDMSPEMQKKLLRVLQEGEIRPVGSKETIRVDVRIISASNKDLRHLMDEHDFREDLYYRVNVFRVELPPLRDRKEDVPVLVDHLLSKICLEAKTPVPEMEKETLRLLMNYNWPGNIRELENELHRAVALSSQVIKSETLSEHIRLEKGRRFSASLLESKSLKEIVKETTSEVEKDIIEAVLEACGWKKSESAKRLGVSRPTLDAKIEAYDIHFPPRR